MPRRAPRGSVSRRRVGLGRARSLTGLGAAVLLGAAGGCERPEPPADRELLVVTADSTFWIRSTGGAIRARGVPMLVARVDGRFQEIYVADDDRSYYDAVFIGHRLFARDLVRGDSIELDRDTVVARLAVEYAEAHPDDVPLQPDEPENDNASIRATSDLEILGITGPYLSYEHHTDVDTRDEKSADHRHQYRRGVIDMRTGAAVDAKGLFGRAADSAIAGARRDWVESRDSLIAMAGSGATRARSALADFSFDAMSFAIAAEGNAPSLRFAVPARGVNPDIEPVELPARRMPAPAWWSVAAAELPVAQLDSGGPARWAFGSDTLTAALSASGQGWSLALRLAPAVVRPATQVSSAIERVIWLDSTVNANDRAALRRAFDEAGNYDGARQVALAQKGSAVHLARYELTTPRPPSQRLALRVVGTDDAAGRERARSRLWRRAARDARQDRGGLRHAPRPEALRHGLD